MVAMIREFPRGVAAFWARNAPPPGSSSREGGTYTITTSLPSLVFDRETLQPVRLRGKWPAECEDESLEVWQVSTPFIIRAALRQDQIIMRIVEMEDGTSYFLVDNFPISRTYHVTENPAAVDALLDVNMFCTVFVVHCDDDGEIARVSMHQLAASSSGAGRCDCDVMTLKYKFVTKHVLLRKTHDFWTRVQQLETEHASGDAIQEVIHKLATDYKEERHTSFSIAPYGRIQVELLCNGKVDEIKRPVMPHRMEEYVGLLRKRQRTSDYTYETEEGTLRVGERPEKRCKT